METRPNWRCIPGIFRKITATTLRDKTRNIDFVRTDVIGMTDLIAVRYSKTKIGMSSNSLFSFQSNIRDVNRIKRNM
jgi:hypothetical protein